MTLTNEVDKAAQGGQVRVIGIVTVNPNLEVEYVCAGDLDEVKRNLLISGLTRLIRKLSD